MQPKKSHLVAIVTVVVVVIVALGLAGRDTPEQKSGGTTPPVAVDTRAPSTTTASSAPIAVPEAAKPAASVPDTASQAVAAPLRMRVIAPAEVRVGEVFDAQVELEAYGGVQNLNFTVRFNKRRLALAGWTQGTFGQKSGQPTTTNAQEPSDGNVEVDFRVDSAGSAVGIGTVAVFQLEAIQAGTSEITLQDFSVIGRAGIAAAKVAVQPVTVMIR